MVFLCSCNGINEIISYLQLQKEGVLHGDVDDGNVDHGDVDDAHNQNLWI